MNLNSKFRVYYQATMENKSSDMQVLYFICYYLIIVILLFSGIMKIFNPIPTIESLQAVFHLPDTFYLVLMTLLPVIEISLAVLMIFKIKPNYVLLSVSIIFVCFLLFAVYGTSIGLKNDCGCFGNVISSHFGFVLISRNALFVILSLYLLIFTPKRMTNPNDK